MRVEEDVPDLGKRTIANGVGSRENLVGTGTDNEADALDRLQAIGSARGRRVK